MKTTVSQRLTAIRKGREYLQDHDWTQEEYFHTGDGYINFMKTDIIGAIAVANGWFEVDDTCIVPNLLFDEILEELNDDIPKNFDDITVVNDMFFSKSDALDQIDKTIRRLEAEPMQLEISFSELA